MAITVAGADPAALVDWAATLQAHVATEVNVDQETLDGELLIECLRGNPAKVEALLAAGAEPSAHRRYEMFGGTPLEGALRYKRDAVLEMVTALLRAGADPSVRLTGGATPVHRAIGLNCMDAAWLLLEHGAALDASDLMEGANTEGDLAAAISSHHSQKNLEAGSAERIAMLHELESDLQRLSERGAGIDTADRYGRTALFRAANDAPESIPLLLDLGASLEHRDVEGSTALAMAARYSFMVDGVQALIEAGAVVDAPDPDGRTPLWHAVENMVEASVRLLVAAGADPDRCEGNGESPRDLARRRGLVVLSAHMGDEMEPRGWLDLIRGAIESGLELQVGEESLAANFRSSGETHYRHGHPEYPRWKDHTMRRRVGFVTERIAYLTLHQPAEVLAFIRDNFPELASSIASAEELVMQMREQSPQILDCASLPSTEIEPAQVLVAGIQAGLEYCARSDKEGLELWVREGEGVCLRQKIVLAPGHEDIRSHTPAEALVSLSNEATMVDGFLMPREESMLHGFTSALALIGVPTVRAYALTRSRQVEESRQPEGDREQAT